MSHRRSCCSCCDKTVIVSPFGDNCNFRNRGFGNNSCWWIIIILLFCCCGNNGFGNCGCNDRCDDRCNNNCFGNNNIILIIILLCCCCGDGNGFGF